MYEWDAAKAGRNLKKHAISFEEAATVSLDLLAITFPDPDHSPGEDREITIGYTIKRRLVFVAHCERGLRIRLISGWFAAKEEYDEDVPHRNGRRTAEGIRSLVLARRCQGQVLQARASAGTNLVLIDADLSATFPDSESVSRGLRLLVETASAAAPRRGKPTPS